MRSISSKRLLAGTVAAGAASMLGLGLVTSSAPADTAKRGVPTITMEFDGMSAPHFDGPNKVAAGSELRIRNNSDPSQIGPHTFTLAKAKFIPSNKQEMKDCGKGELRICRRVAKAHQIDFQQHTVGQPLVENGLVGWDKPFTNKKDGDSWFAENQNDEITQVVSAPAGKTLHYFCIIHPEMQGKIKVVAP